MIKTNSFWILALVVTVGACSSKNGVETDGSADSGMGASGNSTQPGYSLGVGGTATGSTGAAGSATAGTTARCGSAACGSDSCGDLIDSCGNAVSCGYTNCSPSLCSNNVCIQCTPLTDCSGTGKNCGPISDGCGGTIDCGTCPTGQCCGCGNPGAPSVCGDQSNSGPPSGLNATCIVGTQGCLCDTTERCASGLSCTPQSGSLPSKCCKGTDCTQSNTNIAASCPGTTSATPCTPGVTILTASGANDSCGYVSSKFNENVLVCAINALGGGAAPAEIRAFYDDEHALALGCATNSYPVSALPNSPGAVYYPQTGDPQCTDTSGRPLRPSLFITDITNDPNCKAGDQQSGGKAFDPVAVFGTWKSATMDTTTFYGTPQKSDPSPINYWNLGTGADPATDAINACHCTQSGDNCGSGRTGRGFGAEVRYESGLISGHSYRLQVMMHDGDQTQGGDAGESCVIFCAGGGTPCTPLTCADYPNSCGRQPDGCGGLTPNCTAEGACTCPTNSCETAPACAPATAGGHPNCQTAYDGSSGYVLACNQPDGCGGQIPCWCLNSVIILQ